MRRIAEDQIKESIYDWLKKNPEAHGMVSEVAKAINYDVGDAMSFCLHILEYVNAHSEMEAVESAFTRFM